MIDTLKHWYAGPPHLHPQLYRFFVTMSYGLVLGLLLHITYTVVFVVLGSGLMTLVNALSVLAYLVAMPLNRRGRHVLVALIIAPEIIAHQVLATWTLGWPAGFHYQILFVPFCIALIPSISRVVKVAIAAVCVAGYIALHRLLMGAVPLLQVSELMLDAFSYFNVSTVFFIFTILGFYYSKAAADAEARVAQEFERAESLLRNILPTGVIARLKGDDESLPQADDPGKSIADYHDEVSVVFLDICGFTQLASQKSASDTVQMLNRVFLLLDDLVERYNREGRPVEKIKTIGDSYMAVTGLDGRPDHAQIALDLATDMIRAVAGLERRSGTSEGTSTGTSDRASTRDDHIEVRVGIASGPVIAGVMGRTRFIYDLWGDTVNVAHRMQSYGEAGAVHLTDYTHALLGEEPSMEQREGLEIKGKGSMTTWLYRPEPLA